MGCSTSTGRTVARTHPQGSLSQPSDQPPEGPHKGQTQHPSPNYHHNPHTWFGKPLSTQGSVSGEGLLCADSVTAAATAAQEEEEEGEDHLSRSLPSMMEGGTADPPLGEGVSQSRRRLSKSLEEGSSSGSSRSRSRMDHKPPKHSGGPGRGMPGYRERHSAPMAAPVAAPGGNSSSSVHVPPKKEEATTAAAGGVGGRGRGMGLKASILHPRHLQQRGEGDRNRLLTNQTDSRVHKERKAKIESVFSAVTGKVPQIESEAPPLSTTTARPGGDRGLARRSSMGHLLATAVLGRGSSSNGVTALGASLVNRLRHAPAENDAPLSAGEHSARQQQQRMEQKKLLEDAMHMTGRTILPPTTSSRPTDVVFEKSGLRREDDSRSTVGDAALGTLRHMTRRASSAGHLILHFGEHGPVSESGLSEEPAETAAGKSLETQKNPPNSDVRREILILKKSRNKLASSPAREGVGGGLEERESPEGAEPLRGMSSSQPQSQSSTPLPAGRKRGGSNRILSPSKIASATGGFATMGSGLGPRRSSLDPRTLSQHAAGKASGMVTFAGEGRSDFSSLEGEGLGSGSIGMEMIHGDAEGGGPILGGDDFLGSSAGESNGMLRRRRSLEPNLMRAFVGGATPGGSSQVSSTLEVGQHVSSNLSTVNSPTSVMNVRWGSSSVRNQESSPGAEALSRQLLPPAVSSQVSSQRSSPLRLESPFEPATKQPHQITSEPITNLPTPGATPASSTTTGAMRFPFRTIGGAVGAMSTARDVRDLMIPKPRGARDAVLDLSRAAALAAVAECSTNNNRNNSHPQNAHVGTPGSTLPPQQQGKPRSKSPTQCIRTEGSRSEVSSRSRTSGTSSREESQVELLSLRSHHLERVFGPPIEAYSRAEWRHKKKSLMRWLRNLEEVPVLDILKASTQLDTDQPISLVCSEDTEWKDPSSTEQEEHDAEPLWEDLASIHS